MQAALELHDVGLPRAPSASTSTRPQLLGRVDRERAASAVVVLPALSVAVIAELVHALREVLERQREAPRGRRARRAARCRRGRAARPRRRRAAHPRAPARRRRSTPRSVGWAAAEHARRRDRCARAAPCGRRATVRVSDRAVARAVAARSAARVVRPSGSFGSSANVPVRACTTSRPPGIASRERRARLDAPAELADRLPARRRLVERERRAGGCRRGSRTPRRRCRRRRGSGLACDVHAVRAVGEVAELEHEPAAVAAQLGRGVAAVDARAQVGRGCRGARRARAPAGADVRYHFRGVAGRPAGAPRTPRARAPRTAATRTPPAAVPITRLRRRIR